ncbi:MAG: nitroreductase [Hyphomicrobiaceae bacterium]
MDFLELIHTTGAVRRLRPDPVPRELIERLLAAAICAPSPGNSQGWDFVVVQAPEQRRPLAQAMRDAVTPLLPPVGADVPRRHKRMIEGAHHLLAHLEDVPLWIFVCGRPVYPASAPAQEWIAPAVYPAAQNLVLAARALGLGSVFTTYHKPCEEKVRELLDLPEDVEIAVSIPLGYPDEPFRRVWRKPLANFVHWEGW